MAEDAPKPTSRIPFEEFPDERPTVGMRLRRLLVGRPRDLADRSLFHRLSLVPLLAWVGLGADGLSSSCYGPEEAFRTLGEHTYLAVALAGVMALTVGIIAIAYSRVIEHFPHGGGGYVVATKLLGERAGVTSGCALLVDYVLTITVSIAAAGDALFSFLPTAVMLVGSYSGVGAHAILHIHRMFPHQFRNLIFISVGVIDSGVFKGRAELQALRSHTERALRQYVALANRLGFASAYRMGIGTDIVDEAVSLCVEAGKDFSRCVFFAGKLVFQRDRWFQPLLHNQTAFSVQRRLQWHAMSMVILPIQMRRRNTECASSV